VQPLGQGALLPQQKATNLAVGPWVPGGTPGHRLPSVSALLYFGRLLQPSEIDRRVDQPNADLGPAL